jgi:hypothetical protein
MPRVQSADSIHRNKAAACVTCCLSASSVTAIVLCTLDDNTCSHLEQ